MEFLKKLFKDDDKVIGLCAFKKQPVKVYSFEVKFNSTAAPYYTTNTKNNLFLL